ncbi:MAG: 4-hydroxy-tetrahydrodipicolinate synthase [Acidimicrobiia bacterium]|nr:4-hydroxy-tetrahydrodipicolinate synthase [Acidimicrobiia bacterium]
MARFGQVLTAMVTPFAADGGLDLDGAQTLARWLVDNGNDALVVAGTTGESATLSHGEQGELIAAVVDAVDVAVIAGAGSNDTRAAVDLTERATAAGATGILQVTPYYNRPSQAGLESHFRAAAAATDLPVMLYDIPARTGRKIATATMLKLAHDVDNIVALKDAGGDPAETARFVAEAPSGFDVYSGDDRLTLPLLAVGAIGVVGVATHWAAVEMGQMIEAFRGGDVRSAIERNQALLASFEFEGSDLAPNPIPTKALLKVLGLPGGDCRSPMGPEPDDLADRARQVLAGLGRAV